MFNLNRFKDGNNSDDKNIREKWLKFSNNAKKDELLEALAVDNKFIRDDLKIRAMVIDMLDKEFGKNIRTLKSYDFLVDTVINKLKKNQLNAQSPVEE